MRRTLAKFGLPFEKATPLVHFPKALKRPRNTAGPASSVLKDLSVCHVPAPHLHSCDDYAQLTLYQEKKRKKKKRKKGKKDGSMTDFQHT